jgi:UDP-glucuronate 4-epimerase
MGVPSDKEIGVTMKVLVTGAGGFIGRRLAERLLTEGNAVIAVDRLSQGLAGLSAFAEAVQREHLLMTVHGDLAEMPVEHLIADVDAVAHVAGRGNVRASWAETNVYMRDNAVVTDRLCTAVSQADAIRTFLLVSSSSVYGGMAPWSEGATLAPCSPYGVTKLTGEHAARVRLVGGDTTLITVRPFSVYGPRQRSDLVLSRLLDCAVDGRPFSILGDGQQRRDFTFVDDVVECMARLLSRSVAGTFNLCAGKNHSLQELIALVNELLGRTVEVHQNGFGDRWLPEAVETLGFNDAVQQACGPIAWTDLRQGVEQQIEWRLSKSCQAR